MSPTIRSVNKYANARNRRRCTTQERLACDRRQAQHAAQALEQALHALGLPANLVAEIEGRLRSQHTLLAFPICDDNKHTQTFPANTP
jgi:hypothetical protein